MRSLRSFDFAMPLNREEEALPAQDRGLPNDLDLESEKEAS